MNVTYTLSPSAITVLVNHVPYFIEKSDARFKKAVSLAKKQLFDELVNLLDITKFMRGTVEVKNGVVCYDGKPLYNALTERIIFYQANGLNVKPLEKFLQRVMKNVNDYVRDQLFKFLDREHLQITDDGAFLAYKYVNSYYRDVHTNTVDNSVGAKPPVINVDPNPNATCSFGYHVGSYEYATSNMPTEGHIMVCKVNPEDVGSVPVDAQAQKCRVQTYEVVAELTDKNPLATKTYKVKANKLVVPKRDKFGRFCK